LRWGAHSEEVIDVYTAIEQHPRGSFKVNPAYTVRRRRYAIGRGGGMRVRERRNGCKHQGGDGSYDRPVAPRNERQGRPSARRHGSRGRQVAPQDRQLAE
jgi:hypothetical protein